VLSPPPAFVLSQDQTLRYRELISVIYSQLVALCPERQNSKKSTQTRYTSNLSKNVRFFWRRTAMYGSLGTKCKGFEVFFLSLTLFTTLPQGSKPHEPLKGCFVFLNLIARTYAARRPRFCRDCYDTATHRTRASPIGDFEKPSPFPCTGFTIDHAFV